MFWREPALLGETPAATEKMLRAADGWMSLFCGQAPWLTDGNTQSMNLPAAIAGELARLTTVELAGQVSGSARADYLNAQLAPVLAAMRTQCEYAAAGGGLILKPYVNGTQIGVDFVQAHSFIPTAWNACGDITGAVFIEQAKKAHGTYTRLERHSMTSDGYLVENSAYFSPTDHALGVKTPLTAVPEWAMLSPKLTLRRADGSHLTKPLFAYFKIPFANQEDTSSPLGVSVYSRATGLMEQADRQYTRILWEYEGSELAVDASIGALQTESGDLRLPHGKERLFRELAIDKGDGGDLYSVFSPAIRDGSLFNGLNQLLKRVEFSCYLSYGTLSDPQSVEKTAEEIKMSRQRSFSAVCDMQKSLAAALQALVDAMDVYASLYALAPIGAYETHLQFGDAIAVDTERERDAMREDCRDGAAAWWEYRVKFYGESEDVARSHVAEAAAGREASAKKTADTQSVNPQT
ncbi:MAG: phage capsid protein [Ruthenibacterium sp.]